MFGIALLVVGISLLFIGFTVSMAVFVFDTTPPYVYSYAGDDIIKPKNGGKYSSLTLDVWAAIYDEESGVKEANITFKSATGSWQLTKTLFLATESSWSTIYHGYWTPTGSIISPYITFPDWGTYTVEVYMTNYANLTGKYTGTFEIVYPTLEGKWIFGYTVTDASETHFVWQEIESANQTFYPFKNEKRMKVL
jgi:hypothetical protein